MLDRQRAVEAKLGYVVTAISDDADLTNLDRWFERDAGEQVGDLVLYKLHVRQ